MARKQRWEADVVVTSTGPFSGLLLGAAVSRLQRKPLVVDYRDLLATGPNYRHGALRRGIDLRIEKAVVSRASMITGVSQQMVDHLKSLHHRPTAMVMNGYDPSDFSGLEYVPRPEHLRIVHCGTFYPGKRDSAPLFHAIRAVLDSDPTASVVVDLYGRNVDEALVSARRAGVQHVVNYHGQVDHAESLRIQSQADILLLLLWNNPRDASVLSGKLFEYIGAQRPILMLGYEDGSAATLIRKEGLGIATNDPRQIQALLTQAIHEKQSLGTVTAPQIADREKYSRLNQSRVFLEKLESILINQE